MIDVIRECLNKERPSLESMMDLLLEYYDQSAILEYFDSSDLVDAADMDDIVERAKDSIDWDDALSDAVEEEINNRELLTWDQCNEEIEKALSEKPKEYRDMIPDDLWETICDILGVTPNDRKLIEKEMSAMKDRMNQSTYATEIGKITHF